MKFFALVLLILVAVVVAYAPAIAGIIEIFQTATDLHMATIAGEV